MISNKMRETRRGRAIKMPKNIERLYKEGKCSECSVVVTRMDFAKILGKFTKVKIQYESNSTPKTKKNLRKTPPESNPRLKRNENGMVQIHRNAYNQHPAKDVINSKKGKANEVVTPRPLNSVLKENSLLNETYTPRQKINILRESNRLKKPLAKNGTKNVISKNVFNKLYGIIFENPTENKKDFKNKLSLTELLPLIEKNILPSDEWCIVYLPTGEEPKEDKVYDRIAAELEDLMCTEKSVVKGTTENKVDDFPSIMDILNENSTENTLKAETQSSTELKSNLESSDVEAMLLGKSSETPEESASTPMEVDNPVDKLIEDVVRFDTEQQKDTKLDASNEVDAMDNPNSPSILDEALQKGVEEHLPSDKSKDNSLEQISTEEEKTTNEDTSKPLTTTTTNDDVATPKEVPDIVNKDSHPILNLSTITHVVFKKCINGNVSRSVTCPKNLKYSIELEGKSVEFLGAPKFISSLEDLQVLLQIVNDSELNNLYVMH